MGWGGCAWRAGVIDVGFEPLLKAIMTNEDITPAAEPAVLLTDEQAAVVDALILSVVTREACKVAVLIARVVDAAKSAGVEAGAGVIAPRIYALADSGKLAVSGNVRRWRAAEVKKGS